MPTWDYAFVLHNGVWVTGVQGLADATSAVAAGTYIVDAFAGLGRLGFEYCGEVTSALVFKRPAPGEVRAQLSAAFAPPVGIGAESTPGVAPTVVVRPPWFRPEATGGTAAQQRARDTLASVFAAVDAAADSREAMTHEQAEAFRAFLRGVLDEGEHGND